MFHPSPVHIILLLAVLLLVFGTKRLPEVGRALGQGIRAFRGSVTGHEDDDRVTPPGEASASALATGPAGADEGLANLSPGEAVAARQATPAPTPEVAVADEAERPMRQSG